MIRVLQFADIVNRYDFIDTIVQHADPSMFELGVCVRSAHHNIAEPVYAAHTPRWVLNGTSRSTVPAAAWKLSRILREWKADILHAHHYDQAFIAWLATRLYPKTRLILGRHYSDSIYRLPPGAKQRALLGVERTVNNAAARIIVPSAYIVEILTKRQGVKSEKIDLVHYGFEPEKYTAPQAIEIEQIKRDLKLEGRFVIGNFSRLHEEKGQRFLLHALATLKQQIPNIMLLVVGEGEERTALEKQVRESGLSDVVQLLGWRRDAMAIMAAVDAVVQPTLQEAFSQVMVEALWMRKPLVITDVSGAPDIITHGENGLLVSRGNADELALAITHLARDENLRQRLGEAGRAYVEEHLVIDKVIKRYEQSYLRAMN